MRPSRKPKPAPKRYPPAIGLKYRWRRRKYKAPLLPVNLPADHHPVSRPNRAMVHQLAKTETMFWWQMPF